MEMTRNSEYFKLFEKNYWSYYKELENEFLQTRRYVEFCCKNMKTHSIEYLKLFQAVCSEIDVVGKAMAKIANYDFEPEDKKNNILKWWFEIQNHYYLAEGPFTNINPSLEPVRYGLTEYKCFLLDSIEICPWENFQTETYNNKRGALVYRIKKESKMPSWWSDYNNVKHYRMSLIGDNSDSTNYEKANLGNLCQAFAALYILEKAFMDTVGTKDDLSSFLDFSNLFVKPKRYTNKETELLINEICV